MWLVGVVNCLFLFQGSVCDQVSLVYYDLDVENDKRQPVGVLRPLPSS